MESIDNLSEYADKLRVYPGVMSWDQVARGIDSIAEDIEAEISERYIPLPLDADGVKIRIGDTVRELDDRVPMKVTSLTFYEDCVDVNTCGMNPNLLYHVKPRTIEDVLREFVNHVVTFKGSREGIPIVGIDDSLWRDYYAECADELRDLMGVEK